MLYMSQKLNNKQVFFMGLVLLLTMMPMLVFAKSSKSHRNNDHKENTLEIDPKVLCSQESEKQLSKLEIKGVTRFSDYKFDTDAATASDAEFTDMGSTSSGKRGRKKRKHVYQPPAKPEYGKLLVMRALGKEKTGWRNLVVKCGVNSGKLATFTYEILSFASSDRATSAIENTVPTNKTGAIEIPRSAENKDNAN